MITVLLAAAAVAVVAWFAAGTIWNVRKGSALMRWMQGGADGEAGGLRALGERTTVRWLGSTAVEMVIRDAKAPFTEVTLVIFLEPRDMPWMWALGRSRGRRDTLIIRAVLRRAPEFELEALAPLPGPAATRSRAFRASGCCARPLPPAAWSCIMRAPGHWRAPTRSSRSPSAPGWP